MTAAEWSWFGEDRPAPFRGDARGPVFPGQLMHVAVMSRAANHDRFSPRPRVGGERVHARGVEVTAVQTVIERADVL